jgi:hypothetical protein
MYSLLIHKPSKLYLGYNDGKAYIVGFKNAHHARVVSRKLSGTLPELKLRRSNYENIAPAINDGLLSFGMDFGLINVTMDPDALLEIPLSKNGGRPVKSRGDVSLDYRVMSMNSQDVFSYPFDKRIGLIIPDEIVEESDDSIKYMCQVLDPVDNIEMFRSSLKL